MSKRESMADLFRAAGKWCLRNGKWKFFFFPHSWQPESLCDWYGGFVYRDRSLDMGLQWFKWWHKHSKQCMFGSITHCKSAFL